MWQLLRNIPRPGNSAANNGMKLPARPVTALALPFLASLAIAGEPDFDLLEIQHRQPKGRVQDYSSDPVINSILASGKDAIPVLIELIQSERIYEHPPIDYWPKVREGDMALAILSSLFLDPTWKKSTLPELCWDKILGRTDSDLPAWALLERHVSRYGRSSLSDKWRAAWLKHRDSIVWDEEDRYFRVAGRELVQCL